VDDVPDLFHRVKVAYDPGPGEGEGELEKELTGVNINTKKNLHKISHNAKCCGSLFVPTLLGWLFRIGFTFFLWGLPLW